MVIIRQIGFIQGERMETRYDQLIDKRVIFFNSVVNSIVFTNFPDCQKIILEELVEIYLSGEKNSVKIPISANVVTRQIAILDNSNHPINVADFGNIYVQECFKEIKF